MRSFGVGGGTFETDHRALETSIGSTAYACGISRPTVTAADEPIRLTLEEGGGCPAIEVDGTMLRRAEPGEALDVRLVLACGQWCGSTATATSAATGSSSAARPVRDR